MNSLINYIIITILLILFSGNYLYAQVTIGNNEEPAQGSLLHLKQFDNGTSSKGLILPRVALTNKSELYPMFLNKSGEETLDYKNNKEIMKENHTGLIVFNTNEQESICAGVYVWNKQEWIRVGKKNLKTVQDIDGNLYPIHTFGTAGTWMLENLRVKHMPDGTALNKGVITSISDKKYEYPGTSVTTAPDIFDQHPEYGLLYTWAAATNGKIGGTINEAGKDHEKIQGICPDGWYVPRDLDWKDLIAEIASKPTLYSTNTEVGLYNTGKSMKSPTMVNNVASNGLSRAMCKKAGFNILLIGRYIGIWNDFGTGSHFWSSSSTNPTFGHIRTFKNNTPSISSGSVSLDSNMLSVRCKKNE